jgi:hypothetical protein
MKLLRQCDKVNLILKGELGVEIAQETITAAQVLDQWLP